MKIVRVLIVDDSVVYRSQIRAALAEISSVEIVGAVSNGRIALDRVRHSAIDLLILDLEMPEMNGLQTLEELRRHDLHCKVLVFSSASKKGAEITLEALRLGASDFITKPGSGMAEDNSPTHRIRSLLEPKIIALFDEEIVKKIQPPRVVHYPDLILDFFNPEIVVIGSSTGGPTALESIFFELSSPINCPILITQHMPPLFTATLAERLQRISGIPTQEAIHGQPLEANKVYIAPGDFHMSLVGNKERANILLDRGPLVNSVRPAVDPLFSSAAGIFKEKCLGIVLTGMGSDGKFGAECIKKSGGAVLIQSQDSCVVFGMPGAVMAAGAYDKILDPAGIAQLLQEKLRQERNWFNKKFVVGG